MTIRKILAPLVGREPPPEALAAAFDLAEGFDAYVEVFHPRRDPARDIAYLAPGPTGLAAGPAVESILQAAEEEAAAREAGARALYDRAAPGRGRSGFLALSGRESDMVAGRARLADLTVLPRPSDETSGSLDSDLETVLFESGRPVLLVPPGGNIRIGGLVAAVAWNDSPEAARAVGSAMPFLARAERVVTIAIGDYALDGLGEHLGHHGIRAEPHPLEAESGHILEDRTGDLLLDACRSLGAGLLVMGAFTHMRIRQLVIAGATRTLLSNATLPVLMAH